MTARQSTTDRFWQKVRKTETCWLWTGSTGATGYGVYWAHGKHHRAHRFAYEMLVGSIPANLELDHLCRVRRCVRPSHLEPVSHAANMNRGVRARQTHCQHGHPLSGGNLSITTAGSRQCRKCQHTVGIAYRAANSETIRAKKCKYRAKNRDAINARARERRKAKRDAHQDA